MKEFLWLLALCLTAGLLGYLLEPVITRALFQQQDAYAAKAEKLFAVNPDLRGK